MGELRADKNLSATSTDPADWRITRRGASLGAAVATALFLTMVLVAPFARAQRPTGQVVCCDNRANFVRAAAEGLKKLKTLCALSFDLHDEVLRYRDNLATSTGTADCGGATTSVNDLPDAGEVLHSVPVTPGCTPSVKAAEDLEKLLLQYAVRCKAPSNPPSGSPVAVVVSAGSVEVQCNCCGTETGSTHISIVNSPAQLPPADAPQVPAIPILHAGALYVQRPGMHYLSMGEVPVLFGTAGPAVGGGVSVVPWRLYFDRFGQPQALKEPVVASNAPAAGLAPQVLRLAADRLPTFLKTFGLSVAGVNFPTLTQTNTGFAIAATGDLLNDRDPLTSQSMAKCLWTAADELSRMRNPEVGSTALDKLRSCTRRHPDALALGMRWSFSNKADQADLEKWHTWFAWDRQLAWWSALTSYADFEYARDVAANEYFPTAHVGVRTTLGTRVLNASLEVVAAGRWRSYSDDSVAIAPSVALGGSISFMFFDPISLSVGGRYDGAPATDPFSQSPAGRLVISLGWTDTRRSAKDYFEKLLNDVLEEKHKKTASTSTAGAR